jgi:hypothetical protein
MKDIHIKNKAMSLRKRGYSYCLILKQIKISKSTLSSWLKEVPFEPNEKVWERIKTGPLKSGRIKHNKRVKDIAKIKKEAKEELGVLNKKDLWMIGLGLYMGEGSKTHDIVRVINSDPKIIKLAIKWFKDCCGLKNENLAVMIHVYPDCDVKKCESYWRKVTKLSVENFRKTQVDLRKNKATKNRKKLPFGTAHISAVCKGNSNFGVKLHRRIMGWIESSLDQI